MSTAGTHAIENIPRSGVKLLSFDACGPRAVSQLQILVEVMNALSRGGDNAEIVTRPCDVFDAIGGVGTGGLIAVLLVVLKMTALDVLNEFTAFTLAVFGDVAPDPKEQTRKLREAIQCILDKHGVDGIVNLIPSSGPLPTCILIIPVMFESQTGSPCVLRNYVTRQEPPIKLTIFEAMLASCATPPIFTPVRIGGKYWASEYVGGDIFLCNPTREIIAEPIVHSETRQLWHSNAKSWISFFRRLATNGERIAQELGVQMAQLSIYHRISVKYGMETRNGPLHDSLEAFVNRTIAYLKDVEVLEALDRCVDAIQCDFGFTTLEQLRHSGGAQTLPPPLTPLTPNYVERKAPMEFIENVIFHEDGSIRLGSKRVIVTGMGGCGKTQLVRKFVESHENRFKHILFVDGSREETTKRDITQSVRSLSSTHSQTNFYASMRFLSRHSIDGELLMIIDNLDDSALDLSQYLPRWGNGTVIVTSRNHSRGQLNSAGHLQLDVMSQEESIDLLSRGLGQGWISSATNTGAAVLVAKELGYLPIALVQAISYMYHTGYSAESYISRLRSNREGLLRKPASFQVDMRYQTAFAAFDASYDALLPNAQLVVQLLSFFHWQNFPVELIILGAEKRFSVDAYEYMPRGEDFSRAIGRLITIFYPCGEWDMDEIDAIVAALRNHSLVTVRATEVATLLQMHPLVHEWARLHVSDDDAEGSSAAAVRLISCAAQNDRSSILQYLPGHIQALSPSLGDLHVNDVASFGHILLESGMYAEAARFQESCLATVNHHLRGDEAANISATANLGIMYGRMGDFDTALKLKEDVLRRRVQLLGMDHPETIHTAASVAVTYSDRLRYDRAEELQQMVLRYRKQVLGPDHLDTIVASANLAATYGKMRRFSEAEALEVEVLAQCRRLLRLDHPSALDAAANLAVTYLELERYAEAEALQVEVLKNRIMSVGERHPDTIRDMISVARTYHVTQRNVEALDLMRSASRIALETLGNHHPISMEASRNLKFLAYRKSGVAAFPLSYRASNVGLGFYHSFIPDRKYRTPAGNNSSSAQSDTVGCDSGFKRSSQLVEPPMVRVRLVLAEKA